MEAQTIGRRPCVSRLLLFIGLTDGVGFLGLLLRHGLIISLLSTPELAYSLTDRSAYLRKLAHTEDDEDDHEYQTNF